MQTINLEAYGRITSFDDWSEKTVRCVITDPGGQLGYRLSAVIVFEDDTWSGIVADGHDDNSYISLTGAGGHPITMFLSADDLFRAGMVNQAQCEHLKAAEDAKRKADLQKEAANLRKEAESMLRKADRLDPPQDCAAEFSGSSAAA